MQMPNKEFIDVDFVENDAAPELNAPKPQKEPEPATAQASEKAAQTSMDPF